MKLGAAHMSTFHTVSSPFGLECGMIVIKITNCATLFRISETLNYFKTFLKLYYIQKYKWLYVTWDEGYGDFTFIVLRHVCRRTVMVPHGTLLFWPLIRVVLQ